MKQDLETCSGLDGLGDLARIFAPAYTRLAGAKMRTDVRLIHHPDRFLEPRSVLMWRRVLSALEAVEQPILRPNSCCISATEMVHA